MATEKFKHLGLAAVREVSLTGFLFHNGDSITNVYGRLEGPKVLQGLKGEMSSPGACQKVSRMNTPQTSALLDSTGTLIVNTNKFQLHISPLDSFQS